MKASLFALVLTLVLASFGAAQSHLASVRGVTSDISRTPLSGVEISFVQEETNQTWTTTSDPAGAFAVALLPPGSYRLSVEQPGFKKYAQRFRLEVNQELRADISLELGALAELIEVAAPLTYLQRDSASLKTVVDTRQIAGLPLDGRNFLELSLLVPGAAPSAPGSAGSVRGDFAFHVSGAREDANSFLLDGVLNVDPKLNTFAVKPPVDAVREFEIVTSTPDASFGRNAGAQVNVVTNSGTNQVSGTAYEFFRNNALDARNFFAPTTEPDSEYLRNQFGGSLGGPVARDRTFFFVDYEGTRVREGITRVTNVPTLLERAGDFSQSLFRRPTDPFTQLPFPGGRIPPERMSPIGRAVAALYPEPNRQVPFKNFVSSPALRDRNDHVDARLDHALGDVSDLVARYSIGDRTLYEPFSGPGFAAVPGFGTNIPRRAQNLMIGETHRFSPRLLNEARFGFTRVAAGSFHENMGRSVNRQVGLPELSSNPRDFGLSFLTVSGFSPLGDESNNPQHSVTNALQAIDNVTYTSGKHLVKVGIEARAVRQDAYRDVQSRGFLTFSDQVPITGNALADLLLGFPVLSGGARLDNEQRLRTESYAFFLHDSVWLSPRLTLSAGLRYEDNSPPVDARDRANVYDPATRALVRVGSNGIPRGGYENDRNNWAPRLGLAWTPDAGARTVLRLGYGVYYDQSALAPGEGLYFNPPYFDFNLYFPLPGLPLTLTDPFPGFFPLALPRSALAFQRDFKTARMQHWNVNLQRELGRSRVVEVAYVGSRGSNLLTARDINQPPASPRTPNLRPVPQFDDITQLESRASSDYKSLQVRVQQRLDEGLSVLGAYTLSKSEDDASNLFSSSGDPNFPQNSLDPAAERGRSSFDIRHRLSVSFSYALPIGAGRGFIANQGWLSSLLADWEVYGIVTLQSGRPFTVALLSEIDNSNTGRSSLGFGANDRPNLIGDPEVSNPDPDRWFNTAAFAFPPFGSFGNAGRNILEGPGYQSVNLGLFKNVRLPEAARVQLRLEAFNLFNRTNFDLPDNFLGSPTFGSILSAQSPRRLQFGAKLLF